MVYFFVLPPNVILLPMAMLSVMNVAPVTVTAVDDDIREYGRHWSHTQHSAFSLSDIDYVLADIDPKIIYTDDGATNRYVPVLVEDNECGAWGRIAEDLNYDCYVDLEEVAQISAEWLNCNDPFVSGCVEE